MTDDERRARAISDEIAANRRELNPAEIAYVIRESDEAAGLVTVPREPTEDMISAGLGMAEVSGDVTNVYQAMLQAYEGNQDE